jgi:hypothetical protein
MDETAKEVATSTTAVTPTGAARSVTSVGASVRAVIESGNITSEVQFELLTMDFSEETPEEKKIRLGGLIKIVGAVIPAIAPFVPALQPVAAVIGALKK